MFIMEEIKGIVENNSLRLMKIDDDLTEYYQFVEEHNKRLDMLFKEMAENRKELKRLLDRMDNRTLAGVV